MDLVKRGVFAGSPNLTNVGVTATNSAFLFDLFSKKDEISLTPRARRNKIV